MTETEIKLYDNFNLFSVTADFPLQIEEAVIIGSNLEPSADLKEIDKIIICGMGGSAIGGDLLRSYLLYECRIPIYVNRNYKLPAFANEKTLVVISSYSGNTEESLSSFDDAVQKGCKIVCSTSGGNLLVLAQTQNRLIIKVPKGYQPRCALAYSFFPLLMLLSKLGLIEDKLNIIVRIIELTKRRSAELSFIDESKNNAIRIAKHLQGKIPVIYSSCDLLDIANLRWRCQIEENAKCLAYGNFLPEMNHNEIVGWEQNPDITKNFAVIALFDKDDNPRITKRMHITLDVIKANRGMQVEIDGEGETTLERIIDIIYLGDWVSFYLAIFYKVDPFPIEKINILKNKLMES
jgi:glucose/mannose-6-phosphate isomerase